jgi:hypothetical protein
MQIVKILVLHNPRFEPKNYVFSPFVLPIEYMCSFNEFGREEQKRMVGGLKIKRGREMREKPRMRANLRPQGSKDRIPSPPLSLGEQ